MSPEILLDAMQHLPDEMLEQTDRLRQKRGVRWQRWAAVAACLCLVLGIGYRFMISGAKSKNDAAAPDEAFGDLMDEAGSSGINDYLLATVTAVDADSLTVILATGEQAQVLLRSLDTKPTLEPGQKIRLYLKDSASTDNKTLTPYKIEIEEESP